jgi:hypothetical protein
MDHAIKLKQFGITMPEPEMTLVLLAQINKNKAAKHSWGHEFCTAMSEFEKKCTYSHVHNATSLTVILKRFSQLSLHHEYAPAPGGSNAMAAYKSVLKSQYEASLLDNS